MNEPFRKYKQIQQRSETIDNIEKHSLPVNATKHKNEKKQNVVDFSMDMSTDTRPRQNILIRITPERIYFIGLIF